MEINWNYVGMAIAAVVFIATFIGALLKKKKK